MTFVKLPNGDYINPLQVVRLGLQKGYDNKVSTVIYTTERTLFLSFDGDMRDELAALIFSKNN
jgi:hypothetical protein